MVADSPVSLPESVETAIQKICLEKNQPPLKYYAREMLSLIEEQASLKLLSQISSSVKITESFSGFVSHLVKKEYPDVAATVLRPYDSPQASPQSQRIWSPSSATSPSTSPHKPSM